MPINEKITIVCDLVNVECQSRDYKLMIANTLMESIVKFLNGCFSKLELKFAQIPYEYDPTHESRWMYFFLRETIRNSIDSCYSRPADTLDCIKIKVSLKTVNGRLHLKIKDNGVGFPGIEPSIRFTKAPENTKKDKTQMLGGKGFGLGVCQEKLPLLLFKNRKHGGASVQFSLGEESKLVSL
jgi:nitrogen fixation/metabolism regulation signal transduction histidine kinase